MICRCPVCNEFCFGTTNSLSSAGINTVNKVADGIENLKKQLNSSGPLIQGVGKAIMDSASSILNWDTYYEFKCDQCGNRWAVKKSDAVDDTDEYYHARESQFKKQRGGRILTINPDADCIYPKDNSLILLRSIPEGIILPDNKFQKGEIYISHPADETIFFPSTSYRYDVMRDELDDIIVFLQKLGAKTIRIKGGEQTETKSRIQSLIKESLGINAGEKSGSITNSSATSDSMFNKLSRSYSKEIKSEILHEPEIDEALLAKWGAIRKEWNVISQMREHGVLEYEYEIMCTNISSNKNIHIDQIEAEYRELCLKTSVSVSREIIRSIREETHIGFVIHVDFYSRAECEQFKSQKDKSHTLLGKLFKI